MPALLTFLIKLTIFEIQTVVIRLGMPALLNEEELSRSTVLAKGLSNFQSSKVTGLVLVTLVLVRRSVQRILQLSRNNFLTCASSLMISCASEQWQSC